MTACLAGWLQTWEMEDAERDAADLARGNAPVDRGLLVYKRKRVATVKRAMRRIGAELGLDDSHKRGSVASWRTKRAHCFVWCRASSAA
jgi:hypothetical protein